MVSYLRNICVVAFLYLLSSCNIGDCLGKRLCGKELSDTLELICQNNYNGFPKKSVLVPEDYYEDFAEEELLPYPYNQIPLLAKIRGGGALIPKVRRIRHGVSDECCKKSCSYKELASYCKVPGY